MKCHGTPSVGGLSKYGNHTSKYAWNVELCIC